MIVGRPDSRGCGPWLGFMSLVTFARNAVTDPKATAAVVPSSRHLADAMVAPLRERSPRLVVEFGPGTGVMTRELLRLMPPDGILLAFEVSQRFVTYLRDTVEDPRLRVVPAGAETAPAELRRHGYKDVDAVVSSLGIALMDQQGADTIFRPLLPWLAGDAVMTQFQYVSRVRVSGSRVERFDAGALMARYFHAVESKLVLRNLPPAIVFTCRQARMDQKALEVEPAEAAPSGTCLPG